MEHIRNLEGSERIHPHKFQFHCFAGSRLIAISETGYVRPCVAMPAQYFDSMLWPEYIDMINRGAAFDYSDCIKNCANAYIKEGKSISSIYAKALE